VAGGNSDLPMLAIIEGNKHKKTVSRELNVDQKNPEVEYFPWLVTIDVLVSRVDRTISQTCEDKMR